VGKHCPHKLCSYSGPTLTKFSSSNVGEILLDNAVFRFPLVDILVHSGDIRGPPNFGT